MNDKQYEELKNDINYLKYRIDLLNQRIDETEEVQNVKTRKMP